MLSEPSSKFPHVPYLWGNLSRQSHLNVIGENDFLRNIWFLLAWIKCVDVDWLLVIWKDEFKNCVRISDQFFAFALVHLVLGKLTILLFLFKPHIAGIFSRLSCLEVANVGQERKLWIQNQFGGVLTLVALFMPKFTTAHMGELLMGYSTHNMR